MSAIFISHSSKDDKETGLLAKWLQKEGYLSIFLDHDPEAGILAGENWEKVLYQKLKACQAVIVLCSKNSEASKWCFAEIALAKYEGKKIIPIIIDPQPEEIPYIIKGIQSVDFSLNYQLAHDRLRRGLHDIDVDARPEFKWDGRSPYPGLAPYEKEDEIFFYGRSQDIQNCQDTLRAIQRKGDKRFCMLLGASGSGKSSLMRAGLLPVLQRDKDNWLVIDPFRPERDPFLRFAVALSVAFERYNEEYDWKEILEKIQLIPKSADSENNFWIDLARELKASAKHLDSTVLICIDQFEEFFGNRSTDDASRFLQMLRLTLNHPECPFMVIGTMRSDFLAKFQSHPELAKLEFETFSVRQLSSENFIQIIEKPAELIGLKLEPGLAQVMAADSGDEDSLPLLAFTLREMWENFQENNQFSLHAYREHLGGISEAVAKVAAEVVDPTSLSKEQQTALRQAFRMMVQINDESQYVRQPVWWDKLPKLSHEILERFINSRLLVSRYSDDGRKVEVAHDALFRQWDLLMGWLDDDRGFLLWQKRLSRAISEWDRQSLDQSALLSGAQLTEALRWLSENRTALSDEEIEFIAQSKSLFQSRQLAASAQRLYDRFDADIEKGIPLAIESVKRFPTLEGDQALRRGLQLFFRSSKNDTAVIEKYKRDFLKMTGTQDLDAIQTALRLQHSDGLEAVAFSQDGRWLGTACHDGSARVWDSHRGEEVARINHEGSVKSIAFSPESRLLATASWDHSIHILDIAQGTEVAFYIHSAPIEAIAFSPDGQWLATGGWDNTVRLIETKSYTERALMGHDDRVNMLDFSANSQNLVSASADHTACIWRVPSGEKLTRIQHKGPVNASLWGPGSKPQLLATGGEDKTVCLWMMEEEREVARLAHKKAIHALRFSADGKRILTAGSSHYAVVWEISSCTELARLNHDDQVECLDCSQDGQWVATGSVDCTSRIWHAGAFREAAILKHRGPIKSVAFSPDSRLLATVGWQDYFARIWYFLPDDLINKACSVLKKDLSHQEWQTYFGDEPYQSTCS